MNGCHYLLASLPSKTDLFNLNGTIHNVCIILKYVALSASESEFFLLQYGNNRKNNMPHIDGIGASSTTNTSAY